MSIFNGKQKYWLLGACAGILVLAGGLCAILLSGNAAALTQAPLPDRTTSTVAPPTEFATATPLTPANIVVGTPEVDQVAEQHRQEMEAIIIQHKR